ncbi:MAG: hypothetical protein LBT66_05345 [Methanobrevibacter sp.]|jgi:hypothetical protein|nr:hypothetical protein [Candidatus Methanovirga meridionalis]
MIKLNENNEVVDELLSFLFSKLNEKKMNLSKFRVQKAIFQIKMDLGENHPLFNNLPYYWYCFGPFSNFVADSFNFHEIHDENNFNIIKEYLPDLDKIITNLLEDKNYFYNQLHKDIYKKYAPFKCMYTFKFELFDTAEKCREIKNKNWLINTFYECESQLPFDSYFNEYSDIFSIFITKLSLINEENNLSNNWSILREPIKRLWYTFAKGLRVQCKDSFYDNMGKQWDLEFNENIKILRSCIDNAEEEIKNNIAPTKRTSHIYTSAEKRLLNATIGNYLKSD